MQLHRAARSLVAVAALAAGSLLPLTGRAAAADCKPVAIDLLLPHAGVMLGEVHGTREEPAFMGQVVCSLATHRPVVLALEYPRKQQAALDAFLANPKQTAAGAELLKTPFWNMSPGDGRQSQAWFQVLQKLRVWRQQGLPITVTAYDDYPTPEEREAADAAFLSELLTHEQGHAFVVIYSGNIHSMKAVPEGMPMEPPLGARLSTWDLLHLAFSSPGGQTWACSSTDNRCGPHDWPASLTAPPAPGTIRLGYINAAYDGVFGVGPITASPPAASPPAPRLPHVRRQRLAQARREPSPPVCGRLWRHIPL